MNLTNRIISLAIVLMAFTGWSNQAIGQDYTYDDAAEAFTEGREQAEAGQFEDAIDAYVRAVEISEAIGPQADEVKNRAQQQITRSALQRLQFLANNAEWEEAISWVDSIEELDNTYGDGSIYERAYGNLHRFYLSWGNEFLRREENEEAKQRYEQALEIQPNYTRAHYQLGLTHRRLGNLEESLSSLERSMELAEQQGSQDDFERARSQARDYLIYLGSEATSDERFTEAEEHLTRALQYDAESARLHYRLAEMYNLTERYNEALNHANTALDYEDGGQSDHARIYFELGEAHKGLDNISQACDAYINAAHGDTRSAAEHELEHELDCDGWEEQVGRR